MTVRAHPVGEARGRHEHPLCLRVDRALHDISGPARFEECGDACPIAQRADLAEDGARSEHEEHAGRDEKNHHDRHDRLQHPTLGYAWTAADLQAFTSEETA